MVKVALKVQKLPPSGIREFFDLVITMKDVVSLGVGEPDFTTPWHISDYAIEKIKDGFTTYTSNSGLYQLREAISKYLQKTYNVSYDPNTEILITVGVSEGMDIAFRAMLEPNDEVIIVEPCYVAYSPLIDLAGGKTVSIKTSKENGFKLTPYDLEKAVTDKTKVLFLNYPCNPTGTTYSKEELEALCEIIIKKDLFVVSDEIYHQLSFDAPHTSLSSLSKMKDRVLLLNGFSKGYAMTGWRIGYACGPKELIAAMTKIHQYSIMCVPTMGQFAACEALNNGEDSVIEMKNEYMKRRNFIVQKLNDIGLKCHNPGGTFYVFPEIPKHFKCGKDFSRQLLESEKVAVVPGEAFNSPNNVRISYAYSMHNIETALSRIKNFLDKNKV